MSLTVTPVNSPGPVSGTAYRRSQVLTAPYVALQGIMTAARLRLEALDTIEPDWDLLMSLWEDPKAQAFLTWPASCPLPSDNPLLQQLLATTQRMLAPAVRPNAFTYRQAAAAVNRRAVLLLAKLLHLLQQHPCPEVNCTPPNDPSSSVWFCVAHVLYGISTPLRRLHMAEVKRQVPSMVLTTANEAEHAASTVAILNEPVWVSWRQQMEEASGMSI